MRIVAVHQGHFLPWMGYWNKMINADVFVWLDTVQFRKNYFQNRVHIKSSTGEKVWLTVPVSFQFGDRLADVRIVPGKWKKKILGTIRQHYLHAPFFDAIYPGVAGIVDASDDHLDNLNFKLFLHIKELMDFEIVETYKASSLDVREEDPTSRLTTICCLLNATHYIAGKGGANYMDINRFEEVGINVIWQNFHGNQPTYDQINGNFINGLSVIDALFNIGPEETACLIREAWDIRKSINATGEGGDDLPSEDQR